MITGQLFAVEEAKQEKLGSSFRAGITVTFLHYFSVYKILSSPRLNQYIWSFRIWSGQEDLVIKCCMIVLWGEGCNVLLTKIL